MVVSEKLFFGIVIGLLHTPQAAFLAEGLEVQTIQLIGQPFGVPII